MHAAPLWQFLVDMFPRSSFSLRMPPFSFASEKVDSEIRRGGCDILPPGVMTTYHSRQKYKDRWVFIFMYKRTLYFRYMGFGEAINRMKNTHFEVQSFSIELCRISDIEPDTIPMNEKKLLTSQNKLFPLNRVGYRISESSPGTIPMNEKTS